MHIAEGVLSPTILVAGAVLSLGGTALGLKKIRVEELLRAGVLSSFFFVASLIHIPIGVTSAHLIGNGLLGIFLGWAAFPAILAALLLQAVLFQFGGLTVLGVNTCTMATGAICANYLFTALKCHLPKKHAIAAAAFSAGFCAVAISALCTALSLAATDEGFLVAAKALFLAHLPIMIAEGVLTMFLVSFLLRVRPELLER